MPTPAPFDPSLYRQKLRQRTQARIDTTGLPASSPSFSANLGAAEPPVAAQAPEPTGGMGDQPETLPSAQPGQAPQKIDVMPPGFDPGISDKKLAQVKTMSDLIDAMPGKRMNQYLTWWEQQHGSIDEKWNAVEKQIGPRPDADRPLDRKEKFKMLTEFGLSLIRQSSPSAGNHNLGEAAAGAVHDAVRWHQGSREIEQEQYNQNLGLARAGRDADQKEIGSLGGAIKTGSEVEENLSTAEKNNRPPSRDPTLLYGTDDTVTDYDPNTRKAQKIVGADGKPIRAKAMGSRGGLERDTRSSEEKKYDHLISLKVPSEVALRIAYRQMTGDQRKDWTAIYRDAIKATYGDADRAKEIADAAIQMSYGEGASPGDRDAALMTGSDDPLGIRQK